MDPTQCVLIAYNFSITSAKVSSSKVVENSTRERSGLVFPIFFILATTSLISVKVVADSPLV